MSTFLQPGKQKVDKWLGGNSYLPNVFRKNNFLREHFVCSTTTRIFFVTNVTQKFKYYINWLFFGFFD